MLVRGKIPIRAIRILVVILGLSLASSVAAETDMSSLWPNADGLSLEYEQTYTEYLRGDTETTVNQARFFFDGYDTVPGGIEAQNLEVEILPPPIVGSFLSVPSCTNRHSAMVAPSRFLSDPSS